MATQQRRVVLWWHRLFVGVVAVLSCACSITLKAADVPYSDSVGFAGRTFLKDASIVYLRDAIDRYGTIAAQGGWPNLPPGEQLQLGVVDTRNLVLRERLQLTKDLAVGTTVANPRQFDAELAIAVRRFQLRHGLRADGVVGPGTHRRLNESVVTKLARLRLNLVRELALAETARQHADSVRIQVNIPEYRLRVLRGSKLLDEMEVVVGKSRFATPELSHEIDHLVFNPYWNLPKSLTRREVLPQVKRDRLYLERQNMEVLWRNNQVDPWLINWDDYANDTALPFRLRQKPGENNALGRVKFMFRNPYNVYLHDTPVRSTFSAVRRASSHGCVRLERANDLARLLLKESNGWSEQQVAQAYQTLDNTVYLHQAVPIEIVYVTTKADESVVRFFDDLYGRDRDALAAGITDGLAAVNRSDVYLRSALPMPADR